MAQTTAEKKSRFARVAVPRIETAIDLFRKHCAAKFDLDVHFTINEVSSKDLYDPKALEEFLS